MLQTRFCSRQARCMGSRIWSGPELIRAGGLRGLPYAAYITQTRRGAAGLPQKQIPCLLRQAAAAEEEEQAPPAAAPAAAPACCGVHRAAGVQQSVAAAARPLAAAAGPRPQRAHHQQMLLARRCCERPRRMHSCAALSPPLCMLWRWPPHAARRVRLPRAPAAAAGAQSSHPSGMDQAGRSRQLRLS